LLTQVTFRAKGAGQTTVRIEKGQFGTQKGEGIDRIDPTLRDDVTFDVAFDSSSESFEVQVEAPQPEPEAEAEEAVTIVSPTDMLPEGFSTTTLLLMGLIGGGVVVLGGQFLLFGLRRWG
jgi:hypothetical protein